MKKMIALCALPVALCIACASGTHSRIPPEASKYSETVVIPGMSKEEVSLKLMLYQIQTGENLQCQASDEQYTVSFNAPGSSPSTVNSGRETAYAKASELRKAMYRLPLDDEEERLENASRYVSAGHAAEAADRLYAIAIANPNYKEAVAMYAASIADNGRYDDAINLLGYALDAKGAPDILRQVKAKKEAQAAREAEEYRRREAARAAAQEEENRRYQAELMEAYERGQVYIDPPPPTQQEEQPGFWEVLGEAAKAFNEGLQKNNANTGSQNYNPQTQNYGGGGSAPTNCSYFQQRYDKLRSQRDDESRKNNERQASAKGKQAAHSIAPDRGYAPTSGDYKLINSSKQSIREYERQMQSVSSEASRAGCRVY